MIEINKNLKTFSTYQPNLFEQAIITHSRENNSESEVHLEENKKHFSKQCEKVLQLLKSGHRLTTKSAMMYYGIWSLPRRILDLKRSGVEIKDEWILDSDGKTKIKIWYL